MAERNIRSPKIRLLDTSCEGVGSDGPHRAWCECSDCLKTDVRNQELTDVADVAGSAWEPVTRYTRAGKNGKMVRAPCGHTVRVYHFAWSGMGCSDVKYPGNRINPGCGEMHHKTTYEVVVVQP
jgi:hypothetical protein